MYCLSIKLYNVETQVEVWENKKCILFAHAIITSTAHASFAFLSSYRDTVLNESACLLWVISNFTFFYTIHLCILKP